MHAGRLCTMARWHDARWQAGRLAGWHEGTMARCRLCTMARWHDAGYARWHTGTLARCTLARCTMHDARWHDARWHAGTLARCTMHAGRLARWHAGTMHAGRLARCRLAGCRREYSRIRCTVHGFSRAKVAFGKSRGRNKHPRYTFCNLLFATIANTM